MKFSVSFFDVKPKYQTIQKNRKDRDNPEIIRNNFDVFPFSH